MANSALGVTLRQIQQLYEGGAVAGLPEVRLLERFAATGDGAAFEALVARHGPMVLGVCRSVLKDEHDAEDAFQATFLTLARKAGSVRVEGTLGGWLYRVAFRVAVQANAEADRRRARERKAGAAAPTVADPGRESPWRDDVPILHEEIDRLPERHRAPVVLCYLEGMTYDQAARLLHWTEPTLRSRLSKARERLKARLTRRGVTGAGAILGALLSGETAPAAVPPSWVRGAVDGAARGTASSAAAAFLVARARGALIRARLRAAVPSVILTAAVSLAVALGVGRTQEGGPPADPPGAGSGPPTASTRPAPGGPGEMVDIRGRVVDPTGRPVAAATVRLTHVRVRDRSVRSGADGRFTLEAPRDFVEAFARGEIRFSPRLVATAPGFGPGQVEVADRSGALGDVTVRLAMDDLPIEGRVLDLEGRPIAGVEIRTSSAFAPPGGELTPWVEAMKVDPTGPHEGGLEEMPLELSRTTGPDGRFRLDGVGRERLVMFTISGPTIAVTRTFAMTKDVPPVRSSKTRIVGPKTMVFHGARFDFAAAPCKPVEGVVRDRDTGRPLAGVRVNGMAYEEYRQTYYHEVASTTDNLGRYRLTGMSPADKYRLFLFPGEGQPYPAATFVEPAGSPGLAPATIDLRLKRGVLVRGRITDKATGEPVKGASVEAFALRDNPRVNDYPGFRDGIYAPRAYADADGRFTIAAVPGKGILGVSAVSNRYLRGVGAEASQGKDKQASLPALPRLSSASNYNLVVPFDSVNGTEPVMLDLQVDPGRARSATIVDADGKPVPGCLVYGLSSVRYWDLRPLDSATFEVTALDPRKPRRVLVVHEGRKLGGSALVGAEEGGPVTITLRRCGVVTGRLVDEDGRAGTRLELISYGASDTELNNGVLRGRCPVDQDGRFRIEVVPGLSYTAGALADGNGILGRVFTKLLLEPGEVKDLGDIRVK